MKRSVWQTLIILLLVLGLAGTTAFSVIRWNDVPASPKSARDKEDEEEDEEEDQKGGKEDRDAEEEDGKKADSEDRGASDEAGGIEAEAAGDADSALHTADALMSGGSAMQMVSQYIPSDATPDPEATDLNAFLDEDGYSLDWTGPFYYTKIDGLAEMYENMGQEVPPEARQKILDAIGPEFESTMSFWNDGTWDLEVNDDMMRWDFSERDMMSKEEKESGAVPMELTISNLTDSGFAIERTFSDGDETDEMYGTGDFRLYGVLCEDSRGKLIVGRWIMLMEMYSQGQKMGNAMIDSHFELRPETE